jgi:hypothetical protein
LYNVKDFKILVPRTSIVYSGDPSGELEKMYEAYLILIQDNPRSAIAPNNVYTQDPTHGLNLLNELFNNEDFVEFINELVENFETMDINLDDEEETEAESFISEVEEETPTPQPKKKKRRKIKPETNKLPYNPENPPEDPQSWSDDPKDYI